LAGCFVAHRSKTTAGILPLRFAHPAKIRSSATTPVTDLEQPDNIRLLLSLLRHLPINTRRSEVPHGQDPR
jgi:hypothetical protein